ncbi:hypothetical protein [Granulicella sibirica]|uniref:Uncharacterized protein n=1 Tax=Granulicella sibirica TaxID=2479048 RepID=A0A4Q0T1W6_9BACT|nr:hypothetical protein [Granulicella sibirica]RXH56802.1 hypothetical protein GRAN_0112 [Granulicella sibirica]
MKLGSFLLSTALLPYSIAHAQSDAITIPSGTPLPVTIKQHLAMKAGEPVRAELIYPVYDHDHLVLPAGTTVAGTVVALTPDRTRRIHARLRADFTPFHIPVVRFNEVILANGTHLPLTTGTATDGAPIYRLVPPPPAKGGFVSRQFEAVKQMAKDRIAVVTGPDKGDRLKQLLYSQLPYHPERIEKDTSWTVDTAAPLDLPGSVSASSKPPTAAAPDAPAATWILQAYLADSLSSATSKPGQPIKAIVAEPIVNPDGTIAVPQGSILTGAITQAKPARSFGRVGELRFSFGQITFPGAQPQAVQAALTGADGAGDMAMNSEGEVKPKPKDKLVVPLILIALAARPLDQDGGRENHAFAKNAVASNSLGTIGFIIGTAAQKPYLAAGIGYYGSAISIYERLIRKGKEVAFAHDTRVVVQTTARRGSAIKPAAQP